MYVCLFLTFFSVDLFTSGPIPCSLIIVDLYIVCLKVRFPLSLRIYARTDFFSFFQKFTFRFHYKQKLFCDYNWD